jgi:hypothetical protein
VDALLNGRLQRFTPEFTCGGGGGDSVLKGNF